MFIARVVNNIFYFYGLLIILRCFLTWIPSIDWTQQPIKFVSDVTDPYLNWFRKIIPPISGLDISPMIALAVLWILQGLIAGFVA